MASFEAFRATNCDLTDATSSGYVLFRPIAQRVDDELWRGWSPVLEIGVAVRFLPPSSAQSEEQAELAILQQYTAHGMLNHPCVAKAFAMGGTGYGSFIAFDVDEEWLTLDQHFETNDPSAIDRLALFKKILSAFEAAHRKNLYHGRLDASQIIMSRKGPVVYGFGSLSSASARGDVLALGVLLSNFMNGHPNGWRTARVQRVIDRATSASPSKRYADAAAMSSALDSAMSTKRQWVKRVAASVGVVASLLLVGGSALIAMSPPEVETIVVEENRRVTPKHPFGEGLFKESRTALDAFYDPARNFVGWISGDKRVIFERLVGGRQAYDLEGGGRSIDAHPTREAIIVVDLNKQVIIFDGPESSQVAGLTATSAWYSEDGKQIHLLDSDTGHFSCVSIDGKESWSMELGEDQLLRSASRQAFRIKDSSDYTSIAAINSDGSLTNLVSIPNAGRVTAIDRVGDMYLAGTRDGEVYLWRDQSWQPLYRKKRSFITHVLLNSTGDVAYVFSPGHIVAVSTSGVSDPVYLSDVQDQCHDVCLDELSGTLFATTHYGVYQWDTGLLPF